MNMGLLLAALPLLVGGCQRDQPQQKEMRQQSTPLPSASVSAKPVVLTPVQKQVLEMARKALVERGYSDAGMEFGLGQYGDMWRVSFMKYQPGVRSSPGFLVKIRASDLTVISVQEYQ
jgi:hypothetical protein